MAKKSEATEAAAPATYRALVGFNYPRPDGPITVPGAVVDGKQKPDRVETEIHVEAGTTGISDLPPKVLAALLEMKAIEVWPPPPPPPPGAVSVVEGAGDLSLAPGGQLSEVKG